MNLLRNLGFSAALHFWQDLHANQETAVHQQTLPKFEYRFQGVTMKNAAFFVLLLLLVATPLHAFAQCGDGNTNTVTPATYAQKAQQAAAKTKATNAQIAAQKAEGLAAQAATETDPDIKKALAAAARAYAAAADAYANGAAAADDAFRMAQNADLAAQAAAKAETMVVQEIAALTAESYAVAAEAYAAGDGDEAEQVALGCYNQFVDAVTTAMRDKQKVNDLLNITSPIK